MSSNILRDRVLVKNDTARPLIGEDNKGKHRQERECVQLCQ